MKIIKGIFLTTLIVINLWFAVSFIEIVIKNVHEKPNLCSWNFFEFCLKN